MGSGADKVNEICSKSPDNYHSYQKNTNSLGTLCIYCGDVLTEEAEQAARIETGDAVLNEILGKSPATPVKIAVEKIILENLLRQTRLMIGPRARYFRNNEEFLKGIIAEQEDRANTMHSILSELVHPE